MRAFNSGEQPAQTRAGPEAFCEGPWDVYYASKARTVYQDLDPVLVVMRSVRLPCAALIGVIHMHATATVHKVDMMQHAV